MILPLRRVHRSAFVALAILLPVLLASAWRVRRGALVGQLSDDLAPIRPTPLAPYYLLGTDELVYWVPEGPLESRSELPVDAELVGTVHSGALERTPPAGRVALTYSLPHHLVNPTLKDLSGSPARVAARVEEER